MKELTITTKRRFKTDDDWKEYKKQFRYMLMIDFDELEKTGHTKCEAHEPGEEVISTYELKDLPH